jgi:uncharacterized membrane protein YcfT
MDHSGNPAAAARLSAVDVARGIAMLLVVMMHSVLGVEHAVERQGYLHEVVTFATAFRIPAFFLISGLFLRRAMVLGWADLFSRRIYGLIVLYLLWLMIHLAYRSAPQIIADPVSAIFGAQGLFLQYGQALIEPYGLLWFVYLMIVFIVAARLVFLVPRALPIIILVAAGLESLRIDTSSTIVDEFCARFVFFLLGLWLAPYLLPGGRRGPRPGVTLSDNPVLRWIDANHAMAIAALLAWLLLQGALTITGLDKMRGISLIAGCAGASAILLTGYLLTTLLPRSQITAFLRLIGERSIVIYLVFSIPMGLIRLALLQSGVPLPVDLIAVIVIAGSIAVALLVERYASRGWLAPFFERRVLGQGTEAGRRPGA